MPFFIYKISPLPSLPKRGIVKRKSIREIQRNLNNLKIFEDQYKELKC